MKMTTRYFLISECIFACEEVMVKETTLYGTALLELQRNDTLMPLDLSSDALVERELCDYKE
jgi:hypothetical protein